MEHSGERELEKGGERRRMDCSLYFSGCRTYTFMVTIATQQL